MRPRALLGRRGGPGRLPGGRRGTGGSHRCAWGLYAMQNPTTSPRLACAVPPRPSMPRGGLEDMRGGRLRSSTAADDGQGPSSMRCVMRGSIRACPAPPPPRPPRLSVAYMRVTDSPVLVAGNVHSARPLRRPRRAPRRRRAARTAMRPSAPCRRTCSSARTGGNASRRRTRTRVSVRLRCVRGAHVCVYAGS